MQQDGVDYAIFGVSAVIDPLEYMKALSIVRKSSKGIGVITELIKISDNFNGITIPNHKTAAMQLGISTLRLRRILNSAVNADLLYKYSLGHYFLNPFLYMGPAVVGKTSSTKQQKLVRARWLELKEMDLSQE